MNTLKFETPRLIKGLRGWKAESFVNVGDLKYKIHTNKSHRGLIYTSFQKLDSVKSENGFQVTSYSMFSADKNASGTLIQEQIRCTEKNVNDQHLKALALFEELAKTFENVEEYELKEGQLLKGFGYGMNSEENEYIYSVSSNEYGRTYHTISPSDLKLHRRDRIKDINEKFGIGTYYVKGEFYNDLNELNDLVIEAKEKEKSDALLKQVEIQVQAQADQTETEELKKEYSYLIEGGRDNTEKNIRLELKKYFQGVKFSVRKDSYNCTYITWTNGATKEEVQKYTNKFDTGTFDPYTDYHSTQTTNFNTLFGGRQFIFLRRDETEEPIPTREEIEEAEPIQAPEGMSTEDAPELVNYSEKAIALFGDSKHIKEELKKLGCKWNKFLTNPKTGKKQGGWISAKKHENEILKLINGGK